MKVIYRISDGSHKKNKLAHATKAYCLGNALRTFADAEFHVFADNCGFETLQCIERLGLRPQRTSLGNTAGFRHALKYALERFDDDDLVYLLEDDYLHLPAAAQAIVEGLQIADYVSLYDHPDKYVNYSSGGPNPLIRHGGERTRVLRTPITHWKLTNSTTMTFATHVNILREDRTVWMRYTGKSVPRDYAAFRELLWGIRWKSAFLRRGRLLVSPIPALATHCELAYLAPQVDWTRV